MWIVKLEEVIRCACTFLLLSSNCAGVSCFLFLCSGSGRGVGRDPWCSLRSTRPPSELSETLSCSVCVCVCVCVCVWGGGGGGGEKKLFVG